jgi:hypothetical protein
MFVIWNDFFKGWCATPKNNYEARVRDASLVIKLSDCNNEEEAIAAMVFCGLSRDQIEVR